MAHPHSFFTDLGSAVYANENVISSTLDSSEQPALGSVGDGVLYSDSDLTLPPPANYGPGHEVTIVQTGSDAIDVTSPTYLDGGAGAGTVIRYADPGDWASFRVHRAGGVNVWQLTGKGGTADYP